MKTYKNIKEVKKDIRNNTLRVEDDITFEFDCNIRANIECYNLIARNIKAWNISAVDIIAMDIMVSDITARDITARNIKSLDISAWDIKAKNLSAMDIKAWNIRANDITYYAYCIAYNTIRCRSIKGTRDGHLPPMCIDGDLIIKTGRKK